MSDVRHVPVSDAIAGRLVGVTLADAQRIAIEALRLRPSVDAAVDARRLLIDTLSCDGIELVRSPDRRLLATEAARYAAALVRRVGGEPVSRIIGRRSFYGRDFVITPATLDPRPESETLIDAALDLVRHKHPCGRALEILDIGTGSGCLLLTMLAELPLARGTGVDISAAALAAAAHNADRLDLSGRVTWVEGRGFAGMRRPFALVLANPPYIPSAAIGRLDAEVRDFDPRTALDGGRDGLDIYREINADLGLNEGSAWVLFEVGDGQAEDVAALVSANGTSEQVCEIQIFRDMAGRQRCVAVRLQN